MKKIIVMLLCISSLAKADYLTLPDKKNLFKRLWTFLLFVGKFAD